MLAFTIASTWHLVTKRVAFSPHIWGSNDAAAGFLFGANRGNQPRVSRGARLRDLPDAAADEDRVASVCGHQQSKYHCLSVLRLWSDPRSQSTTRCDARLEIGQRQFFHAIADVRSRWPFKQPSPKNWPGSRIATTASLP